MPLLRRLPKRGFKSHKKNDFEVVNVKDLARVEADTITPAVLHEHGLIDLGRGLPVKLLGKGDLDRTINVKVHAASAGARKKVEDAGGAVELLEE